MQANEIMDVRNNSQSSELKLLSRKMQGMEKKYEALICEQKQEIERQRQEIERLKREVIEYKTQSHYWKEQFERLKLRHEEQEAQVDNLIADLKKKKQQLFGKKSEKQSCKKERGENEESRRNRGQQEGSVGHGRREHKHLPETIEIISLENAFCPCCNLPYKDLFETEDSEVVEIDVKAHTRLIKRKKYKRTCKCKGNTDPEIIAAPMIDKLLPKSKLGVSVWGYLLLNKYEYKQPLNRSLEQLSHLGLSLPAGTITDGFKKLEPLFSDIYDAIINRSLASDHWHADETRWKVYEKIEGKSSNNWYLWIFQNKETVVFKMAPSRSSQELVEHFGEDHAGGTLNVDRYSAYKAIAKKGLFVLAFCWAHVRRDFLEHCKGYPELESWGLSWVEDIAKIYHINNLRIQHSEGSKAFKKLDAELKNTITEMKKRLEEELKDQTTTPSKKKILKSLKNHWHGLTVFVECPQIPMDNNCAERGLRPSVVGRKNYYGSGALWSAKLAAYLFTIFSTIKLHGINPQTWMLKYLQECAHYGGNTPKNFKKFLPWEMSEKDKDVFLKPPKVALPFNQDANCS